MKPFDDRFLDDCKVVTEKYDKLMGSWGIDSQLLHIHSEISEVKDILRNKNCKYGQFESTEYRLKLLDEIADVFLTSFSLTNILEISNEDLNMAIMTKLGIVQNRVSNLTKQTFGSGDKN